jgi:hypothetical protein
MDIRKLNGLHYRLLRIAVCDWKTKISRSDLDNLGRVRPTTWAKYATASTVIKILRDREPRRLFHHLQQTLYYERRQYNIIKFFDDSKYRLGRQCIGNRLKHIFDAITESFKLNETDDAIRVKLKRCLGFPKLGNDATSVVTNRDATTVDTNRDATPVDTNRDATPMGTNRDATPVFIQQLTQSKPDAEDMTLSIL